MVQMRPAAPHDLPGIYRVCDETGPPTTNPDLLGHIYAGPYAVNQGRFASVVADEHGVAGYVFGCPDTRTFETWCEVHWWPALREQYPLDANDPDAEFVGLLHAPPRSPEDLLARYPAHLHIDLLPRTQGTGFGRRLIDWLLAELTAAGASGVHLGVGSDNTNAIAFYRHLGFENWNDDGDTLWMVRGL